MQTLVVGGCPRRFLVARRYITALAGLRCQTAGWRHPQAFQFAAAPRGLTVDFTYNGSANAPTNVGSYTVIGTLDDPNYQGSATNTLLIVLQLTAPTWDGNGQFQFTFDTAFGVNYTVEVSTNLTNWTPALSFQGVNGPLTILDPNASSSGQRFYSCPLAVMSMAVATAAILPRATVSLHRRTHEPPIDLSDICP